MSRAAVLAAALAAVASSACDQAPVVAPPDAGSTPPAYDAGIEAGPVACGASTCAPADFRGIATLPACCAAGGGCGLDLSPAAPFVPTPDGCTGVSNAGVADDTCPTYPSPSSLYAVDLQGCCRVDHTCGVFVKLSPTLDLGCVAADGFADDAGPAASCGLDTGDAGDGGSTDDGSTNDGSTDAASD